MIPPIRLGCARRFAALTFPLLLLATAAGCAEDVQTKAEDDSTSSAVYDPPRFDATGNALASFDIPNVVAHTIWANGTYKVQEHFFPLNWIPAALGVPPPGFRAVDITEHVPRDVPVRIVAELDADVTEGSVEVWIEAPFNEVWSGTWDTATPGHWRVELRIIHASDDPVWVGLFYDEADPSVEFPYTLKIDVEADPEILLEAVGAALEVPGNNATLLVSLEEAGSSPALLAWDPEGAPLGRFALKQGVTPVPLAEAGTYLLLLSQGTGDASLALEAVSAAPSLRPARQEVATFEGETSEPSVTWSFEADRAPIQVGFYAVSGTVGSDFSGTLSSSEGLLLERNFAGGPWVRPVMGFGTWAWTPMGGEGHVAGPYEATVSFARSAGPDPVRYGSFLVYIAAMD